MTKKTQIIIGAVIILLIIALLAGFIYGKRQIKVRDNVITMLTGENEKFTTTITRHKLTISVQDQQITNLELAQQALLINLDSLKEIGIKNVQTIVKLKTEITRLQLNATYTTPPVIVDNPNPTQDVVVTGVKDSYMRVPQAFQYEDQWAKIDGTVRSTGVIIDKMINYSQPSVTLGYSRKLFNSKPIVVFQDLNPYTSVKDMTNIIIVNPPPFYKRPWFHMAEGAAIVVAGAWGINQLK